MLKRRIVLPTVTNPNPTSGKTTIVTVPGGLRVHQIFLKIVSAATGTNNLPATIGSTFSGSTANWIGDIRVKLGGKVQRLHSLVELCHINKCNGSAYGPYTVGTVGSTTDPYGLVVPIFFAEPWRNSNEQAEFLAWNTTADRLLEVEIDCSATPSGTTPTISITANAAVDTGIQPGSDKNGLQISKVFRSDFASAANLDITTLDRRDIYQALYIQAANISRAVFKASGLPIHELPKDDNNAFLTEVGLVPQFNYDMVLDADDPIQSSLNANGLNELTLRVEQTSAATIRVLSQRIGLPE